MKPLAIALLLLAISLSQQAPGTLVDPDAYAVYSALIPSEWLVTAAQASELLIQGTTEPDGPALSRCEPSGPGLTGPWLEAMNNFKMQQATSKVLERRLSLPVDYRFESRDTIRSFFNQGLSGWEGFHATYPRAKGYLVVSAVGFDKAHKHALVYMAHSCGGLCGQGGHRLLERTAEGWKEVRLKDVKVCMWVS